MSDTQTQLDPAWKLLLDDLRKGEAVVYFTKRDGTKRKMRCTLSESVIPKTEPVEGKKTRKASPDLQVVWDLDAGGWRSFHWESIDYFVLPPFSKEETPNA